MSSINRNVNYQGLQPCESTNLLDCWADKVFDRRIIT